MAIKPAAPKPAPAPPTAKDVEATFESAVATVEHAVDSWLSGKDRTQPQTVTLPRVPVLDDAGNAEIVRRYLAAGWGSAEVKAGALHLVPATAEG